MSVIENSFPDPLSLDHPLISDLSITLARIDHLSTDGQEAQTQSQLVESIPKCGQVGTDLPDAYGER